LEIEIGLSKTEPEVHSDGSMPYFLFSTALA